jgi:hypothetical protein
LFIGLDPDQLAISIDSDMNVIRMFATLLVMIGTICVTTCGGEVYSGDVIVQSQVLWVVRKNHTRFWFD